MPEAKSQAIELAAIDEEAEIARQFLEEQPVVVEYQFDLNEIDEHGSELYFWSSKSMEHHQQCA